MRHQDRENIDILFRRLSPEFLIRELVPSDMREKSGIEQQDAERGYLLTREAYEHYGKLCMPELTLNEIRERYCQFKELLQEEPGAPFNLLYYYAERTLILRGEKPYCKMPEVLSWTSISSRVGEELFTTAFLAHRDVVRGSIEAGRYSFDWLPILRTDDYQLEQILDKGLAENHYHLNGSTQSFALSWIYLMNYPGEIPAIMKSEDFHDNLMPRVAVGTMDNLREWEEVLRYAAGIRMYLFRLCVNEKDARHFLSTYQKLGYQGKELNEDATSLRATYGYALRQVDDGTKQLDYCVSAALYRVKQDSPYRLLSGERCLLYLLFTRVFGQKIRLSDMLLFHLYIVIKNAFRQELVQINKRDGFANFSLYQDRKDIIFENNTAYQAEAIRLSIYGDIKRGRVRLLEARIVPAPDMVKMAEKIKRLDRFALFADRSGEVFKKDRQLPFFYVIHFIKKPFNEEELSDKGVESGLLPRNWESRRYAERAAKALVLLREQNYLMASRIRGIDACSHEIGCRPETFATEYRYLRDAESFNQPNLRLEPLRVTYHVGEDYLDIMDGLRAVDEAIEFLDLQNGDRIGHGLALGIDPMKYYLNRRWYLVLPAQDLLDNIVWFLYRAKEWNVAVESTHREMLRDRAMRLLSEIYDEAGEEESGDHMLQLYYDAWKLRGDHPSLYMQEGSKQYSVQNDLEGAGGDMLKEAPYARYRYSQDHYQLSVEEKNMDGIRKNSVVCRFLNKYHFSYEIKKKGLCAKSFRVEPWYADAVRKMQKKMREKIAERGISIECNPTSNLLIGPFAQMDEHPITLFNKYHLQEADTEPPLSVSINTDDLGVFATSLESEYARLLCAIRRKYQRAGVYKDEEIYDYLNHLRRNGFSMSFAARGEYAISCGEYSEGMGWTRSEEEPS